MSVTDPAPFLKDMDMEFFRIYKNAASYSPAPIKYVEPHVGSQAPPAKRTTAPDEDEAGPASDSGRIESKIVVLEDFIDTDAVCLSFHILTTLD